MLEVGGAAKEGTLLIKAGGGHAIRCILYVPQKFTLCLELPAPGSFDTKLAPINSQPADLLLPSVYLFVCLFSFLRLALAPFGTSRSAVAANRPPSWPQRAVRPRHQCIVPGSHCTYLCTYSACGPECADGGGALRRMELARPKVSGPLAQGSATQSLVS